MLLREPLERDFGFAASAGGSLDPAQSSTVFCPHGLFELRTVRAQQTAEPPHTNPEIV
jgi:hypothetical protein